MDLHAGGGSSCSLFTTARPRPMQVSGLELQPLTATRWQELTAFIKRFMSSSVPLLKEASKISRDLPANLPEHSSSVCAKEARDNSEPSQAWRGIICRLLGVAADLLSRSKLASITSFGNSGVLLSICMPASNMLLLKAGAIKLKAALGFPLDPRFCSRSSMISIRL